MRFSRIVLLLMICLPALGATGRAANPEGDYLQARHAYNQLQESSKRQLYRDNWMKVLDGFEALIDAYPDHRRAGDAMYMAGRTCKGLYRVSRVEKDARRAVEFFRRLAAEYPRSRLADDGLVLAAEIEEEVFGDRQQAYRLYREAAAEYPEGDLTAKARRKLRELEDYAPARDARQASGENRHGPVVLQDIRHWSSPDSTRVVLDLSRPVDYTSNFLPGDRSRKQPPRIYVDLQRAEPGREVASKTPVADGLLRSIRSGRQDSDRMRVVLDLESVKDYKVFQLDDPCRVVIDVAGKPTPSLRADVPQISARSKGEDHIAGMLEKTPEERPLKVHIPAARREGGLRRIVIDAGHGGKDPGAIGPSGLQEKQVTLAIAKRLARELEKDLACEVVLTRDGDVFLPLEERTAIANKLGADLFISIHANANTNRQAYGTETYYLDFAKNQKATRVVARENNISLEEVGNLELILMDLMANAKINESSRLAVDIQKRLVANLDRHYTKIRDLGSRGGPFYVLLGATMPSVLVETAFISNPREEARLQNRKFQQRIARAITLGVRHYAVANDLMAAR